MELWLALFTPVLIGHVLIDKKSNAVAVLPHQTLVTLDEKPQVNFDPVLLLQKQLHQRVDGGELVVAAYTAGDFVGIVEFLLWIFCVAGSGLAVVEGFGAAQTAGHGCGWWFKRIYGEDVSSRLMYEAPMCRGVRSSYRLALRRRAMSGAFRPRMRLLHWSLNTLLIHLIYMLIPHNKCAISIVHAPVPDVRIEFDVIIREHVVK